MAKGAQHSSTVTGSVKGIRGPQGTESTLRENRQSAAARFNRGNVRFLVSTEAAGEGIDLQENCSAPIHVDLPWNPMRLHQRVGRLSRYGQTQPVHVVTVRNPDTVESRIWGSVWTGSSTGSRLRFRAPWTNRRTCASWSSAWPRPACSRECSQTPTHVCRASGSNNGSTRRLPPSVATTLWAPSGTCSATWRASTSVRSPVNIPKVDLPDLVPFFKSVFAMLGKRPNQPGDVRRAFRTPQQWMDDFTIAEKYELPLLEPLTRATNKETSPGLGLRVFDRALKTAVDAPDVLAAVGELDGPRRLRPPRPRHRHSRHGAKGRRWAAADRQHRVDPWTTGRSSSY